MDKKPIREIVNNKEWQDIRKSFLGTWKTNPQKNCARLKSYLGNMNDIYKIRIVQNYLTGTGFRTGRISHICISEIRKSLSKARKRYYQVHSEQILKPMDDITLLFEKTLSEFKTHYLIEQDEEPAEKEENAPAEEQQQAEYDPQQMQQGMDPNMMGGMDPNMMGRPGQNIDPQTGLPIPDAEFIGRVYEMNKIYYFLKSMDNLLLRITTDDVIKLRNLVSKTIELFELVVDNLQSYKDQIDDIIVMFYKFLTRLSAVVEKYFNQKKIEQKEEEKQKSYGENLK